MSWYQVVVDGDEFGAKVGAEALMNKFSAELMAAGTPDGVEVFYGRTTVGGHVYYFSPAASALAKSLLDSYAAKTCSTVPSLAHLTKVRL